MKNTLTILLFLFLGNGLFAQMATISGRVLEEERENGLGAVEVWADNGTYQTTTNFKGDFSIDLPLGQQSLQFFLDNYKTERLEITVLEKDNLPVLIKLTKLNISLEEVAISEKDESGFDANKLKNVEKVAIYAGKKSEVILVDRLTANLATGTPRQVYKTVAGLNIWENDGSGLQLNIGARGLDPNRTSNFNTRQNGYDISADALGYPESYYTPPTLALEKIQIVRGAASLQYGPQFGGLLNFVLKKGPGDKKIELTTNQTLGSFGLYNGFASVGGQLGKLNYYGFYQKRIGNGWRPNSEFNQNTAFLSLEFEPNALWTIRLEQTYMNYLAQQAGGLQDFEFRQNPRQSNRSRNWFEVNWLLSNLSIDYKISEKTKINNRTFLLNARRQALGELGAINRPDPLRERDLIRGDYDNIGNETRLLHRYEIAGQPATFLIGNRIYRGYSETIQGDASDGVDADFRLLNPNNPERAAYTFPSNNVAFFVENLMYLTSKWSLTPGIRWEYIRTASDGFYKERVFSGGEVIFEQTIPDARENSRAFVLLGLGSAYQLGKTNEVYANFSQNYRSINFTDLSVVNPNLIVDSLLQDEKGFNIDLGWRGQLGENRVRFDVSLFHLRYQNRIGIADIVVPDPILVEKAIAYRTNIGDARILGLEMLIQTALIAPKKASSWKVNHFVNLSLIDGKYTTGLSNFEGNQVELIPPVSFKTGLDISFKKLQLSYQIAHIDTHFTDATNAVQVADATRGEIPAYWVQDLAFSASFTKWNISGGINNLANTAYFTRRANAYPGPGIIPADGRSFYISIGFVF